MLRLRVNLHCRDRFVFAQGNQLIAHITQSRTGTRAYTSGKYREDQNGPPGTKETMQTQLHTVYRNHQGNIIPDVTSIIDQLRWNKSTLISWAKKLVR